MADTESLAGQFETHRSSARSVAYRLLGSTSEADDAVQEAWLRLNRVDAGAIDNLRAWLTTVVARVCLDMLRGRAARREEPLETHVPDPIVCAVADDTGVEAEAIRAEAVSMALLVLLDTLDPGERLALVLHDVCGLRFEEIAPIVDRSVAATRQLASRARRRVQGQPARLTAPLNVQRRVVDAFLSAVRGGDVAALVAVLDPAIVLRADGGAAKGLSRVVRGADAVVGQATAFSKAGLVSHVVLVNGEVGAVSFLPNGRPLSVIAFAVAGDKVVEMNILADQDRLARLDLSAVAF